MGTKKWCIVNRVTLCKIPKGDILADILLGSSIELTGRQETVSMLSKDGQIRDSVWVEGVYQNGQGTYIGWVRDDFFDKVEDKFPDPVVAIPNASAEPNSIFPYATRNPNDSAQFMVLGKNGRGEEQVKFNLCGELCVAFVLNVGIKQFLKDWEGSAGSLFKWALGGDSDKTAEISLIKNMLNAYAYKIENGNVIDFASTLLGPVFEGQILSPGRFQKMLQSYYLIANVVINKNTGKLIPDNQSKWVNNGIGHWVVLDKASPNGTDGGHVELYNPYLNRRQEYSYDYFISSFGGGTYTGCWVKRKQEQVLVPNTTASKKWCVAAGTFRELPDGTPIRTLVKGTVVDFTGATDVKNGRQWSQVKHKGKMGWARNAVLEDFADRFSNFEVAIPHPTPEEDDPEQYMFLPGEDGKKRNMCGQLCAAFIIKIDIESFVADWKIKAKRFYELSIAGKVDNGTGIDSLESMFKVSPYNAASGDVFRFEVGMRDPITGILIVSAGKMKKMLENYYLVAGVRIKQGDLTGRLTGQGLGHWVVMDKVFPDGKNGGNGGWVEIYNPFSNKKQEYSYDEFMQSFAGTLGLWVKRK